MYVTLENVYLGRKIHDKFRTNQFTEAIKTEFRIKCLEFYIELVTQIYKRFPFQSEYVNALKSFTFLNPRNIRKINSLRDVLNCNIFRNFVNHDMDIDMEWRYLRNSDQIAQLFELNPIAFWQEIGRIKKGDDSPAFPYLTKLTSFIFTLPHSSAAVERIFSHININKSKCRNRLT